MGSSQIQIGITAEYSKAEEGFSRVSAQNAAFAEGLKRTTAAQEAFSAATTRGGKATREVEAAFEAALTAGKSYTEAMESAVAATSGLEQASTRAAGGVRSMTSTFYAAQGASAALRGAIPYRAMERFLADIKGVNTLLMAAFPIIGAVALGEVAVQAGEKIYNAFDMGGNRAEKTAEQTEQVTNSFRGLIDSTNVEIDRLQEADARLEKKPNPNGLKLAIDEAMAAADRMSGRLDSLIEKQRGILASAEGDLTPSLGQKVLFGEQGNRGEQKMLERHLRYLDQAKSVQDQLNESKSYGATLQQHLVDLEEKQAKVQALRLAASSVTGGTEALNLIGTKDYSKEIASVQFLIDSQQKERESIQSTIDLQDAQTHHQTVADHTRAAREAEQRRRQEDQANKARARDLLRIPEAELRKQTSSVESDTRTREEQLGQYAVQRQRELGRLNSADLKVQKESLKTYEDRARLLSQMVADQAIAADTARKVAEIQIAAAQQSGGISALGAAQERTAADTEYFRQRIEALKGEMSQLVPYTREYIQAQRELHQVQSQQNIAQATNQAKTAAEMAQPFLKATDMVNTAWTGMQDKLIFGTRFVGRQFANMGVSILESVARSFEQMLVKQLQYEVQSRIAHQITNQAKLTSDAQASATGQALKRTSALKEEFINAKVAATGAFKGVMAHVPPPLNFVLAPAAAAAAFAGTLAIGAFEKGGIIPNTGLALVHEGEGVMPRNLTNLLTSVATDNRSSSSTTANITANSHYQGITNRNFREMARRNSGAVVDAVSREMRKGKRR